jgi:hypothetical protein
MVRPLAEGMSAALDGELACFPPDYSTSRQRFRTSAAGLGLSLESYPIGQAGPNGEPLTIDTARLGADEPERLLIVSSGLHGVEGFFGAAVQQAWLDRRLGGWVPGPADALLLVHALDPFGFAWVRRFDETNVDLNRNFLLSSEEYAGSPKHYAAVERMINPRRRPLPFDTWLYYFRSFFSIVRHGMPALKAAIAGGQYEFPYGLFFGGHGPSKVHQIVAENLERWVGTARSILHVDFHTGLGRWATLKLLIDVGVEPGHVDQLRREFGENLVEHVDPLGTAYDTRGDLGTWLRQALGDRDYTMLCAEFGTYPVWRVLAALRAENRAYHWLPRHHPKRLRAQRELQEVFVPADPGWRSFTLSQALQLLDHARSVVFRRSVDAVSEGGLPTR